MDQIYKLTPKEFADMLKFSTSYIRKLRLAKKLEGWYTVIDGKYFYRVPDKDRPNLVSETPHQNPKFTGSQFRPKKYKSLYYKKKGRRRHLPATEDTNYHNARNGWQLEQLNNLRQMARIKGELEKDELLEITPEIFHLGVSFLLSNSSTHLLTRNQGNRQSYLCWTFAIHQTLVVAIA